MPECPCRLSTGQLALILMRQAQDGILAAAPGAVNQIWARKERKMAKKRSRPCMWLLAALTITACGCENQDTDRLAKAARRVAGKFDSLTTGADDKLTAGLQAFRADLNE